MLFNEAYSSFSPGRGLLQPHFSRNLVYKMGQCAADILLVECQQQETSVCLKRKPERFFLCPTGFEVLICYILRMHDYAELGALLRLWLC